MAHEHFESGRSGAELVSSPLEVIMTAHADTRRRFVRKQHGDLDCEASIVWLRDPASAGPWVREELAYSVHRRRRFALPSSAIAFVTIRADAPRVSPGNGWYRRFWWAKPGDPEAYDERPLLPPEAVDPSSIRAGELSQPPALKAWPIESEVSST